jgi:hypothetical protein
MKIQVFEKKMTFLEKRGCGFSAVSLNTPSPAALRRTTGRQTERRTGSRETDQSEARWIIRG